MKKAPNQDEIAKDNSQQAFKPVIGGGGALAISIGGIIGSGIFFILGLATEKSGPGVIISLFFASIIALLTAQVSFR